MNVQTPSDLRSIRARSVGETKIGWEWLIHFALFVLMSALIYALSRALNVPEMRINGALLAVFACFLGITLIEAGRRKQRPDVVFAGSVLLFTPAIGLEIVMLFSRGH